MTGKKNVLLLVGSAKHPKSTSGSLGTYLVEKMQEKEFETSTLLLHRSLMSEDRTKSLLEACDRASIVVFAFPLYIDCLPYMVIRAMELIEEHRGEKKYFNEQSLLCIVNNGFPEAQQNETAIAICRKFAMETGFKWAGGLALGAGEVINGKALKEIKGMARNVIKSLDLAADALSAGNTIPGEAVKLMAKPLIPKWMYLLVGGMGWRRKARKHGMHRHLFDRPYLSSGQNE